MWRDVAICIIVYEFHSVLFDVKSGRAWLGPRPQFAGGIFRSVGFSGGVADQSVVGLRPRLGRVIPFSMKAFPDNATDSL